MRVYILLLLLVSFAFAQYSAQGESGTAPTPFSGTLLVNKTGPASVNFSDAFTIKISVTNQDTSAASVVITEYLGNVEPVSPQPTVAYIENESYHAAVPPKLTWSASIPAGQTYSVNYSVKPRTVGTISFGPTEVVVSGSKFFSNSLFVQVECTSGTTCDDSIGETPLNCPEKCGGSANETPMAAPNLTEIYTPNYTEPADPLNELPSQDELNEKQGLMIISGVVLLLVIAGIAYYFLYYKKK